MPLGIWGKPGLGPAGKGCGGVWCLCVCVCSPRALGGPEASERVVETPQIETDAASGSTVAPALPLEHPQR